MNTSAFYPSLELQRLVSNSVYVPNHADQLPPLARYVSAGVEGLLSEWALRTAEVGQHLVKITEQSRLEPMFGHQMIKWLELDPSSPYTYRVLLQLRTELADLAALQPEREPIEYRGQSFEELVNDCMAVPDEERCFDTHDFAGFWIMQADVAERLNAGYHADIISDSDCDVRNHTIKLIASAFSLLIVSPQ